jgi:hypothetical protein
VSSQVFVRCRVRGWGGAFSLFAELGGEGPETFLDSGTGEIFSDETSLRCEVGRLTTGLGVTC